MRIGFILPNLGGGGTQQVIYQLAGGLLERGHQCDLLVLRPTGSYLKTIPPRLQLYHTAYPSHLRNVLGGSAILANATRHSSVSERLFVSPWEWHRAFRALRCRWPEIHITLRRAAYAAFVATYLRQNQPDVVLAALRLPNVAAVCGKVLAGTETPIVISLHNNLAIGYSSDDLARARALYKEADAVTSVSNGVAENAAEMLGLDLNQIVTIYNPIPVTKIAMAAIKPVEHPWFVKGKIPVVLTAGRPTFEKDHPTLIRAFAILRRSMEVRLVILGDMGQHKRKSTFREARELAVSLGVAENVMYLDFDENPFRYMARAAVVVLSSRNEGLPNVLLEAMACGTPVASTNAPYGPAEILEEGRWGPLVPVGDADALADALAGILAGRRISAKDLQARASIFSTEKAVDKYEKLFSALSSPKLE